MGTLLEKSDSIQLLLTVMSLAKEWLTSPLTHTSAEDKSALLKRMRAFDRLPEIAAQPVLAGECRMS